MPIRFARPARPRYIAGLVHERKVTWLELFFDLVFVAAVAQVAEPLRHDYSIEGLVRFVTLFVLIWWAWTGHAVFSTRFDTDDIVQRGLTLLQMFAVAAMAANAKDALGSRSSAGFAAAYAAVRFVLVFQYFRARHVPHARRLTTRYLAGHGVAAVFWLASAFVEPPARFAIWAMAFIIDLGTPWLAVPHSVEVPPDSAHLPERFGLFTLILLGESVVAVMQGMESQQTWSVPAASAAFLGMGLAFLVWWWYFDAASGAAAQPVRSRRDGIRFHVWSYAHLPLYVGIVIVGVGVQQIVMRAPGPAFGPAGLAIMVGALAVVACALLVVTLTSGARHARHQAAAS
jgi:low temperature requirement protein LtrA